MMEALKTQRDGPCGELLMKEMLDGIDESILMDSISHESESVFVAHELPDEYASEEDLEGLRIRRDKVCRVALALESATSADLVEFFG